MTERREFLRQASLIAAGSLAASSLNAQAAAAPQPTANTYDMSWVDRVTGKYRMVFDAPEVAEGTSLHQVRSFLAGYAAVYGLADADLSAVLVVRHTAMPMVLGDALWADGAFGESSKIKTPGSEEHAKLNPFIKVSAERRFGVTWPDGALDTLMTRGMIVLVCDLALSNMAGQITRRRSITRPEAAALITEHLLPGVYRMPTGVFATCRAQAAGCGFLQAV